MKVLFFTYDFPYPTTSGGKVRAFNMLKYAGKGVEISLFSFIRPGFQPEYRDELKKIGISHVEIFPRRKVRDIRNIGALLPGDSLFKSLYYDQNVADRLTEFITTEHIDILHCESFYTAFYMSSRYKDLGVKQVYGSENKEHALYEDYVKYSAPLLLKPGFTLQAKKIKKEEDSIVKQADVTLAVTESEKEYFASVTDHPVVVIENGVSLEEFSYKPRQKKQQKIILFVGNFDYFPNVSAVNFFYHEVLSRITDESVIFSIIGKKAKSLPFVSDKRVRAIEFIPDIRDAYYEADVFVSPIQIGGGTNFKILEAMATGLPIVTFSDRVKDIGAEHMKDVLTADDAKTFYEQVMLLLHDEALGKKLSIHAREIIEKKFSWVIIGSHLNEVWRNLYEKI